MAADPHPAAPVDLRTTLAAVPLPRVVVRVAGPDAITYLQGQLSQDVAALAPGASAHSFLLQPAGKVDAWLRITRPADEAADDTVVIDVDGGHGEPVVARLRRFLLRTKADVDLLDWQVVALRGPGASTAAAHATAELRIPGALDAAEAVDLLGPRVQAPDGVPLADTSAYEALRIRSGIPAMGAELTEATIPAEAGQHVIDASVSFTKGCFTGQELVARIDSRGGNVPRRVRGLVVPGARWPAPGAAVVVAGDEVGHVTSVAPDPAGGGALALAIVGRAVSPPAAAEVAVDGERVAAEVVDVPMAS